MLCRRTGLVADRGANMLEYVGITIVVAGVVTALAMTGLATDVPRSFANGVCRVITPDDPDCQETAGPSPGPTSSDPSSAPTSPGQSSPPPTGQPPTGGDDEPSAGQKYAAAEAEAAKAAEDAKEAEDEWGDIDEALLDLVADLVGWNSAKDCFTKGDIGACLETLLTAIPWGKLFKAAKMIPKIWKLFRRFQKAWDRVKKARKAKKAADDALEEAGKACNVNSFTSGTPVLLAGGRSKPISEVGLGDRVMATDPTTGRTAARAVTALIRGQGVKRLVDVTFDLDGRTGGAAGTVTATDGHPFWLPEAGRWADAADLRRGDRLRAADGRTRTVTALRERTQILGVYNLTVAGLHTYYVLAGGTPVLVHNVGCSFIPGKIPDASEIARGSMKKLQDRQLKKALATLDEDPHGFKADWVGKPNVAKFDANIDADGRIILVSKDGKTLVPTNYKYEP